MPTVDGLPYPNSSATPDVPGDMLLLVNAIARKSGSGVARAADAAGLAQLVTDGLVTDGMLAQQTDTKAISQRRSASWLPPVVTTHRQLDTTNDVPGTITQIGTGRITGTASASISETVTFPVPFAGVPVVTGGYVGGRTPQGGAFNDTSLVDVAPPTIGKVYSPSTTGFTVAISRTDAAVLSATYDYYYSWIAVGVPA